MILFALFVNLSLQGKVPAGPLSQSLPIHNRTDYNFDTKVFFFCFFMYLFFFLKINLLLFLKMFFSFFLKMFFI